MDKQFGDANEMVEEIEQFLARKILGGKAWNTRDIAEGVYELITENAVVLMGMETEQQFEDLMVAFDEMGFMPNTTHPFPEEYVETWKQRLIFVFGQLRKETAKKFARLVEFHSVSTRDEEGREIFTISALGLKEILHEEFGIPYDEICKEHHGGER